MKLEEGETICPKCNGGGLDKPTFIAFPWCTKCKGHGKLDWVEMVVGKRLVFDFTYPMSADSYRTRIRGVLWNNLKKAK